MRRVQRPGIAPLVMIGLWVPGSFTLFLPIGHAEETPRHAHFNDCGPEALSAALAERQVSVAPEKIAELAGTDATGTTMLGLKRAAEALGVKAQGMRLSQAELESYVEWGYGVIAFVHRNHYVWVRRIHPKGVVLKDVGPGFHVIPHEQWYAMWFESKRGKPPAPEEGRGLCLVLAPHPTTNGQLR